VISETAGEITDSTPYVVARDQTEALQKAEAQFGVGVALEQDPDALDTWFSSGLWPFSTMGWPDRNAADFNCWYPTSLLVTGFDIIFFWVARMTMLAGAFTGQMPFKDVYIHGLVRDEQNRKMSKSAGNGIDPLRLIDRYGADALRFALVREVAGAGQDIRLDYDRKTDSSVTVEGARNFANKLWNASRFALMNLATETPTSLGDPEPTELQLADRWILSRLARVNQETAQRYGSYALGEAAKGLYEFAWNEVCDWSIELLKPRFQDPSQQQTARQVLAKVLNELLVMLHPLMPHLTEELWHGLSGFSENKLLALQPWPIANQNAIDPELEERFVEMIELVRVARNLRATGGMKPGEKVSKLIITTNRQELRNVLELSLLDLAMLTKSEFVEIRSEIVELPRSLIGISGTSQVQLQLPEQDLGALRSRLEKDLAKAEKDIIGLKGRLANPNFADKAPAEVVLECRANLVEAEAQAELARERLGDLG
jgi:valyl-tRNA synthetase